MIPWSAALKTSSPGRTGIAPVHLLDVEDVNGNCYYWASRRITAASILVATGGSATNPYLPWMVGFGDMTFNRSMATDVGALLLQNLSGDSLQTDFYRIVRKSAIEGAIGVYRRWNAAAQDAEEEFHATLSVDDSNPSQVSVTLRQLGESSQDITPRYQLCEICQWRWSSAQCGSTASTPCQQTYETCQVLERIFAVTDNFEKNFGETLASVAPNSVNRMRQV
jgi:hypothetical protein